MTDLSTYKSFVASIDPSWPEEQIASALGEALSLHSKAALSLRCVRTVRPKLIFETSLRRKAAATSAPPKATPSDIDALIG